MMRVSDTLTSETDWTFLRRPRWVLSHLLVLGLLVGMVAAGIWQIQRHGERGDRNDLVRARSAEAVVPLATVADPSSRFEVGEDEQFRRVTVTGTYAAADQVLVRNRSLDGAPGLWVLTPLVTDEGWAAVVNRGWISLASADVDFPPPSGQVTIEGWIQPSRRAEGLQRSDPATGTLASLARPDIERIAQQVDYGVAPLVVQLVEDGDAVPPLPLTLPSLDAGPHASYAAQWFIFATIALVGYPLILRRTARGQSDALPFEDFADAESERQ